MIYLDNAATTAPDPEIIEATLPCLYSNFGNPSSIHRVGRKARETVEHAREQVANAIGCDPEHIIFTSGGTESNNTVFNITAPKLKNEGRTELIVSSIEHESVLRSAENLFIKEGFHINYVAPDKEGRITEEAFLKTLCDMETIQNVPSEQIGLVSIMLRNNETGVKNDVVQIANVCRKYGILFHSDCVQAAYDLTQNITDTCDFISLSAHKIHGLKGTGVLYVKDPEKYASQAYIVGGSSQERGIRSGTENLPGIVAFGAACEKMVQNREEYVQKIKSLKMLFKNWLEISLEESGLDYRLHYNCRPEDNSGILNFRIDGVDGETLAMILSMNDICISTGSACRSRTQEPSYVLSEMGITNEEAMNSVRISFSRMNTYEEVVRAAISIAETITSLASIKN